MGVTKFKQLNSKLSIGLDNTFFVIYDNEKNADYRVSLRVLIDLITSGSLGDYIPLTGTDVVTGNIKSSNSFFQLGLANDTSFIQFINTLLTIRSDVGNFSSETKNESFTDGRYTVTVNDSGGAGRERKLEIKSNQDAVFTGDVISYNADRTIEIDANSSALISRSYADAKYASINDILLYSVSF